MLYAFILFNGKKPINLLALYKLYAKESSIKILLSERHKILTEFRTPVRIKMKNQFLCLTKYNCKMKKKLFIFDVDGVLLDLWTPMKDVYEEYNGFILTNDEWNKVIADYLRNPAPYMKFGEFFDASNVVSNLPPIKGMPELVAKLKSEGFDLAIITSISNKDEIKSKRIFNLRKYYGDAFDKIICVERGGSKEQALREAAEGYQLSVFCDDHPKNVLLSKGIVTMPLWFVNQHLKYIWDQIEKDGLDYVDNAEDIQDIFIP